jgi:hypothetical protein
MMSSWQKFTSFLCRGVDFLTKAASRPKVAPRFQVEGKTSEPKQFDLHHNARIGAKRMRMLAEAVGIIALAPQHS